MKLNFILQNNEQNNQTKKKAFKLIQNVWIMKIYKLH